MRRPIAALAVSAALGTMLVAGAPIEPAGAQGHEQVVFSGEAEGSGGEIEFWIWCAVDESGAYDDCSGAVRFPDMHLARHVEGEVSEVGDDAYRMDVESTRDDSVVCSLTNSPPITHGHTNTVDVSCSTPSLTATTTEAVVTNGG
jgi:hypothetical protein